MTSLNLNEIVFNIFPISLRINDVISDIVLRESNNNAYFFINTFKR